MHEEVLYNLTLC